MIDMPLGRGSLGQDVYAVQAALQRQGHAVSPDGVYGASTERAVRLVQEAFGIPATGRVDDRTMDALGLGTVDGAGPVDSEPSDVPGVVQIDPDLMRQVRDIQPVGAVPSTGTALVPVSDPSLAIEPMVSPTATAWRNPGLWAALGVGAVAVGAVLWAACSKKRPEDRIPFGTFEDAESLDAVEYVHPIAEYGGGPEELSRSRRGAERVALRRRRRMDPALPSGGSSGSGSGSGVTADVRKTVQKLAELHKKMRG